MRSIQTLLCVVAFLLSWSLQAQNVGIGVDTPQTKLHVAGTILTDSLKMPTGARDGYVLQSDSLGNGFWSPVMDASPGASLVDAKQLVAQPEYIVIQDSYAYVVTDLGDSLLIFDLNNPSVPEKVGGIQILFPHTAQGLVVDGNFAYADYGNKIFVYDVTDPTNPVYRSFVPVTSEAMAYANGYIYAVGSFENALFTINASDPDSMFHVDTLGIGGDPNGIAIQDGIAYVVDAGSLDLKVFDLSDPENPILVGSAFFGSHPLFIDVLGDFAYVTDHFTDSVYIFNVSDPANPVLANQIGGFSLPNGIHADDMFLHVSDSALDSLFTFNITDPNNPTPLGAVSVNSVPTRMDVRGDYIYLLNESPRRIEVLRVIQQDLLTTGLTGENLPFDGLLPGLITIGSNNLMDHLRLNRIGVGGVHLTATDPAGLLIASDSGNSLISANATSGAIGIGHENPIYDLDIYDDNNASISLQDSNTHLLFTTSPIQASIGTVNEKLLKFFTNNTYRMTINHLGFVGIGEGGPNSKLVVRDDSGGENFGGPSLVQLYNGADKLNLDGDEIDATAGTLYLQNNVPHDLSLVMGGGTVGIGTDAPAALLEVSKPDSTYLRVTSTNNVTAGIDLIRSSGSNTDWRIENGGNLKLFSSLNLDNSATEEYSFGTTIFRSAADNSKQLGATGTRWTKGFFADYTQVSDGGVTGQLATGASTILVGSTTSHGLDLMTDNTTRMHIDATGKVGMGTSSPDTRLHLDGADNDGSIATLKITSGSQSILMDGNEIDAITDDLHLQNNSSHNVILVNGGGMVGIGTSSPNRDLTIFDTSGDGGAVLNIKDATRELFLGVNSSGVSLRSLTADELSFWTDNVKHMTIEVSGEVGIGTPNPTALLEVNAATVKKVNGGSWTASSDIRLKQNIRDYRSGLDDILRIRPVRFSYNDLSGYDTAEEHIGVIAQELDEVAPYMVGTFQKDGTEYLEVDNSAMIYMLINAVKELDKKIQVLESENAYFRAKLEESENQE